MKRADNSDNASKSNAADKGVRTTMVKDGDSGQEVPATATMEGSATVTQWVVSKQGDFNVTKIMFKTSIEGLGEFDVTELVKQGQTSYAYTNGDNQLTTVATLSTGDGTTKTTEKAAESASAAPSVTEQSATQTTTNTQASATSTGSHQKSSGGVSTGAVAGAAVGCLLGGLLIGALAAFLFFRRRGNSSKKRHSHENDVARVTPIVVAEKSTSPGSDASDIKLDHFLLDATPDKQIAQELRGLGDLVNLHVDNNYHLHPVNLNPASLAQSLLSLGLAPESASAVASLAIDQRSRALAIRHIIAAVGIASIDVHAKSPLSLLPAPVAAFLQSMPPSNSHSGPQAGKSLITPAVFTH